MNRRASTWICTLSLHDALPISRRDADEQVAVALLEVEDGEQRSGLAAAVPVRHESVPTSWTRIRDRKSTRLNSSHMSISYAVFCLKKKTQRNTRDEIAAGQRYC